jgi:hypothetical protein
VPDCDAVIELVLEAVPLPEPVDVRVAETEAAIVELADTVDELEGDGGTDRVEEMVCVEEDVCEVVLVLEPVLVNV